jgi:hypothetical protein
MIADTFIKGLQEDWAVIMPKVKKEAIKVLTTKFVEIDFKKGHLEDIPNDFGIYLFQIYPSKNFDFDGFRQNWRTKKPPDYSPNISKSRIEFNAPEVWKSFYIGKAEKLSNRINEHCFQEKEKTTYGLKLMHRTELLGQAKFRYSYYKITDDKELHKDKHAIQFVMTNLEREIRNEINPWIGKQ